MIKLDLNELVRDKKSASRLILAVFLAFFLLSPGLMALVCLDRYLFVELSDLKLIALSFGLSVLLIVLAGLAAISPRSAHIAIFQNPAEVIRYILSIGTVIWAYLFVLIIPAMNYVNVKIMPWIGGFSYNKQLGITYLMFLFFCILINVWQMAAMLKNSQNA